MLEYHLDRLFKNQPLFNKFTDKQTTEIKYDPDASFHTAPFIKSTSNIFNLNAADFRSPEISAKVTNPAKAMPAVYNDATGRSVEEYYLRNMVTFHIRNLRNIYDKYAGIGLREDYKMATRPVLVRLFLWQFFRDCGLQNRGVNLIQLDRDISRNVSSCVVYDHLPFERLQFFQFLHCVLEVTWILYGKYMSIYDTDRGVLATCLDRFINDDALPGTENHSGCAVFIYRDIVPWNAAFKLYQQLGEPTLVIDYISAVLDHCQMTDEEIANMNSTISTSRQAKRGKHFVVGDNVLFIPGEIESILQESLADIPREPYAASTMIGLKMLEDLSLKDLLICCAEICPAIMNDEKVVDKDYELTFLEFYELLIECVDRIFYNIEYNKWDILEKARIAELEKLLKQNEGKMNKGKDKKDKKKK